ncbi:uncharacterized protein LTR77_002795 [Saxophila tyrrhenica]|uniref:Dienelactone hydrolase domain-containing protein n=1 Tax=Saxophila tyrrhenica TaxID=1690608 RepID=A0AAV9PGG2_9PEZI|nr:hypothetical protein LTR77_002795 [Saxophila tyrrhenica]
MSSWSRLFQQFERNLRQNLSNMTSSLSARSPTPARPERAAPGDAEELKHAPGFQDLAKESNKQICNVKALEIKVSSSDTVKAVAGFLHTPQNYRREQAEGREKTAAILLSGAGGGVVGPSSIYLSIADKLASLRKGIPVLRLDYRYPARNKYCVPDVLAAMNYLENGFAVSRFVLVGWSFGSAPVLTVGAQDDRVVGCATVAGQTAETEGMQQVARRNIPTLLLHGTSDRTLSPSCSESLREKYRRATQGGHCELQLFDGDDHALSKNALKAEERLCDFIMAQAGEEIGAAEQESVVQKPLLDDRQRRAQMEKGGDLQGESIE